MGLVKLNDRGVRSATAFGSVSGGAWNFISKQTASSDDTIDFTSGIDSTYKEYLFTLNNIHPQTDQANFQLNFRDGSTAYDATKTTTNFMAYHNENDAVTSLRYEPSEDLAQSTGIQLLSTYQGNDNDQGLCGYMHLFDPSSTTFVKHFISRVSHIQYDDRLKELYVAGYCNVTAAIDGVQFSMSTGNIDSGDFCLYGIK